MKVIDAFLGNNAQFLENAPAILKYLDFIDLKVVDKQELLGILKTIVTKALELGRLDFLEYYYGFVHQLQDEIDIRSIGRTLFQKQLNSALVDPYWLYYAETFPERVQSLQLTDSCSRETFSENECTTISIDLIIDCLEDLTDSAVSITEADLDSFFRIIVTKYPIWVSEQRKIFIDHIKKLIAFEERTPEVRIKAILFYANFKDEAFDINVNSKWIELLDINFSFDNFKYFLSFCLRNRPLFNGTLNQISGLIDRHSESIPQDVLEFLRRLFHLETHEKTNSEEELLSLISQLKKVDISPEAPTSISNYLISYFSHLLIKMAVHHPADFSKNLYRYALLIASSIASPPASQLISLILGKLIRYVIGICHANDSSEYSCVLEGLNNFAREMLFKINKNDPTNIAYLGKRIVFAAFVHPRFVATRTIDHLSFFSELPISTEEMVLIAMGILLIAENTGGFSKGTFNKKMEAIDKVTRKSVHIKCFELSIKRKLHHQFSWVYGFFNCLLTVQTDLDYLKNALPLLLALSENKQKLKDKITTLLQDHPKIRKDKIKSFLEIVDTVEPLEKYDDLPQLTIEDLEELCIELQKLPITPLRNRTKKMKIKVIN